MCGYKWETREEVKRKDLSNVSLAYIIKDSLVGLLLGIGSSCIEIVKAIFAGFLSP